MISDFPKRLDLILQYNLYHRHSKGRTDLAPSGGSARVATRILLT